MMERQMDKWMGGWMVGWMDDDESVDDGQMMAGQMDVCVDGWINDGRIDDGWMGRGMDG